MPHGGLFAGSFLKSYLSKKGENLATHEDINKLVEQVRQVTKTAEEIKHEVSHKQRLWQLKKEAAFQAVQALGAMRMKTYAALAKLQNLGGSNSAEIHRAAMDEIAAAMTSLFEAQSLIAITCSPTVVGAFREAHSTFNSLTSKWLAEKHISPDDTPKLAEVVVRLEHLIRKDLSEAD